MAEIDHLVYVVPDLAAATDRFESELGVRPEPGGRHPGMGTWNALLALRGGAAPCYLELIAADPDQADPAGPRPFGIDDDPGPRLATFAVRPSAGQTLDDLVDVLRAHDHDPGDPLPMSRTTPAGDTLAWRLTMPTGAAGGSVPFLIDWGDTPMPATTIGVAADLVWVGGRLPDALVALFGDLGLDGWSTDGDADTPAAVLRHDGSTLRL